MLSETTKMTMIMATAIVLILVVMEYGLGHRIHPDADGKVVIVLTSGMSHPK